MKKSAHSSFTKSSRMNGNSIIRYQKAYLNSRIFDNHFDSKLHSAPFLPTRTSRYIVSIIKSIKVVCIFGCRT